MNAIISKQFVRKFGYGLFGGMLFSVGQTVGFLMWALLYIVLFAHACPWHYLLHHPVFIKTQLLSGADAFAQIARGLFTAETFYRNFVLAAGYFLLGVLLTGGLSNFDRRRQCRTLLTSAIVSAVLFFVIQILPAGSHVQVVETICARILLPICLARLAFRSPAPAQSGPILVRKNPSEIQRCAVELA